MTNDLPLPPDNLSIAFQVECDWQAIRDQVQNNDDVSIQVVTITQTLARCEQDHSGGKLSNSYDWGADLASARLIHVRHMAWLDQVQGNHAAYSVFYKDLAKRQYDFAEKIAFGGMNYILVGHGTVAVTCLNALVTSKAQVFPGALETAIVGAVAGILLIAGAQWVAANSMSDLSNRISARLITRPTVRKLNAFGRLGERYRKLRMKWVERLIVASLVSFVIYITWALLLIGYATAATG